MQKEIIESKVKVFISSNCSDKFLIVRESLRIMLIETGLCEVYVFEEASAASGNVKSEYLSKLDRSDLVLFLIDNKEGLGHGTLIEIRRAEELQKKCIYLFCDEFQKEPTETQNELIENGKSKYKIVNKFSEFIETGYKCVLNDVISKYLTYCSNSKYLRTNDDNNDQLKDSELIVTESNINLLGRTILKGYSYTKIILNNDIIFNKKIEDNVEEYDLKTSEILEVVIGNKKVSEIDFSYLKKNITEMHSGRLKNIIEKRLDAVYGFLNGNLEFALLRLKEALKTAKETKKIPIWIVNDIAIDLRYIEFIISVDRNETQFNSEAQSTLDESNEIIYLPIIDRLRSRFYEDIFKNNIELQFNSPFTTHFGGVDSIIDQVIDIFVSGLNYGSLFYILNIREELLKYLKNCCIQFRDHKMFVFTIKMFILSGKKKELKSFLRTYGEYSDNINNEDVLLWIKAAKTIKIRHLKQSSFLLILEFFGNYLNDEHFEQFFNMIDVNMKEWFEEPYALNYLPISFINSIESNVYRIKHRKVLGIIFSFFEKNYRRWYVDIFKLIVKMDFGVFDDKDINSLIDWLKIIVKDVEVTKSTLFFQQTILNLRLSIGERDELDSIIKENFGSYYEDVYLTSISDIEGNITWKEIQKRIESLILQNNTQGKNGVYSGYFIDDYSTIIKMIIYGKISFDDMQVLNLTEVAIGTLSSDSQTYKAKTNALYLILILMIKFPASEEVQKTIELVIENRNEYLNGKEFLFEKGYSKGTVSFIYSLIKENYKKGENQYINIFSQISREDDATRIIILNLLSNVLGCGYINQVQLESQNIIVYFLLDCSLHQDREVRLFSYISLINICEHNKSYSKVILDRLSNAMDGEVYENKVAILSRINQESSSVTKYIFEKGRVDNHFLVRKKADRVK